MSKLNGKVALVSGSGRGIGRAIALKLASEGAKLVVNDMDPGPANEVIAAIETLGGQAVACNGDVTEIGFADRFVTTAIDSFGGLDIIVNNAGYAWPGVIQNVTDEQFQAMLDVHLIAPFRILRAAAHFIRQAAKAEATAGQEVYRKVVNISSGAGLHGSPGHVNYAAAKMGVIGVTNVLSKEWGRYKVNVNSVAFGLIRTRMNDPLAKGEQRTLEIKGHQMPIGMNEDQIATLEANNPLGRAGTPEDAANAVYLLCIPESNYISGQTLVVAGG